MTPTRISPTVVLLAIATSSLLGSACVAGDPPRVEPALDSIAGAIVYGEDDRTEVYEHPNEALRTLARNAIVALVPSSALDRSDPDVVRIAEGVSTLRESQRLCEGERFAEQPTAADCSGTLIDHDLVMTAGHCITSQASCSRQLFVFDYFYEEAGVLAEISPDDVYQCSRLVVQNLGGGLDYAIAQLDRPVEGREPAPVRRVAEAMPLDAPVTIIGFGSGLPAKIDTGGRVLYPHADLLDYFEATTDSFGGNSGSGVFDATGEAVGILVRGETDYVRTDSGCRVVNSVSDDGGGPGNNEEITYAHRALEELCDEVGWPSARLCSGEFGDGWCDACVGDEGCPVGWRCGTSPYAPEVRFCTPPCDLVDGCLLGHSCDESGYCLPDPQLRCSSGDVWRFDNCGRRLSVATLCSDNERCSVDTCVTRPDGDVCATAQTVPAESQIIEGSLVGFDDSAQGSCAGAGPERVYTFDIVEQTRFSAQASGFDTVLHLRSECGRGNTEIACHDDVDWPDNDDARIESVLEPGRYFLFADAYDNEVGDFELFLTFAPVVEDVAAGETCAEPTRIDAVDQRLEGSLADYSGEYVGSCGGSGPERVFSFTLSEPTRLEAASQGFDTVLYVRTPCSSSDGEIACHDDIDPGVDQRSRIDTTLEPGDWFLFLDTWGDDPGASYVLDLRFSAVPCADACAPGSAYCDADTPVTCVTDEAGCGAWEEGERCGPDAGCAFGACQPICEDECDAVGAGACFGNTAAICGEFDGDPCAEWGAAQDCAADESCERGLCVPSAGPGTLDFDFPGLEPTEAGGDIEGSLYLAPHDRPPRGEASCGCAAASNSRAPGFGGWLILVGVVLGFRRLRRFEATR